MIDVRNVEKLRYKHTICVWHVYWKDGSHFLKRETLNRFFESLLNLKKNIYTEKTRREF